MLQKDYGFTVAAFLLCLLMVWSASADEVLVKIELDTEADLPELETVDFAIRFRGSSMLLAQGEETCFAGLSTPYEILDRPDPNSVYLLTRNAQRIGKYRPQMESIATIITVSDDTLLLRTGRRYEHGLVLPDLPIIYLPERIDPHPRRAVWTAPEVKSQEEMIADAEVIGKVIDAVNTDALRDFIYDLQENRDIDPPHSAHKSRYCLRVAETDDPSDDACDNAAEYIYGKFQDYGLEAEYEPFPHEVLTQGSYQMRNVVGVLPGRGSDSDGVFIICAHYDSIALNSPNWTLNWKTMDAPGANDNASGVAGVLEAARVLSKYEFSNTVKFIAFSGEELRLHGSLNYTKMAAEREENIIGVLNLDMIAYDPDLLDIDVVTNESSEWLVEAMLSVQREYDIRPLVINKFVEPEFVYSDHAPFWNYGWNSILAIDNHDFDSPEFYPLMHTTEDTVDQLNFDIATRMIQVAIGTLASLADPMGGSPQPDISVMAEDISFTPENPDYGESVQVSALIYNLGESDINDTSVQVWLVNPMGDSVIIGEELVDIEAGERTQIFASAELDEWGSYRITVKANPDYDVFETNGSNNIAGRDIKIGSDSLALGKLRVYPNPMDFSALSELKISYTLSRDASTRMDIYNMSGELVYQQEFISGGTGGKFGLNDEIEWNGTNLMGKNVAGGIYLCYVVATDGDRSASVSKKVAIFR